ncbi:helix-turn-helix domain-containing protein [Fangia hongkongensis]|uniref:helix-turn-helix domain-containing protein n=1 Tax=Fangia hongkongensis TaxID=270495 RepID=UPI00036695DE|nr:helix-turn-helix domain-containing protein [Fangia hongkongensis]MBK2123685.1 helix-turn-helix domain-containing protein [Fangia hongkongensis]
MTKAITCSHCDFNEICHALDINTKEDRLFKEVVSNTSNVKKGTYIYHKDDQFSAIYSVRSGAFKSITEQGNIIGFHLQGDIFGLDGIEKDQYTVSSIAMVDSVVCQFDFSALIAKITQNKAMNHHFLQMMSKKFNQHLIQLEQNKPAEQKLCTFLLQLSCRQKSYGFSANNFTLPMKRSDLANYLNLTVETISRTLHHLVKKEVIFVQNKTINILDLPQLKNLAQSEI